MVYMAESVALAVLENLVHMNRQDFPSGYVCVSAVLPDDIAIMTEHALRMQAKLRGFSPQALGDWWLDRGETAVLQVGSAVVAHEHIFLINPAHPDFPRIAVDPPALFHFDSRLFG